jgi:integrase
MGGKKQATRRVNFTKRTIAALGPREGRYNVFDSQVRGLYVAVYPSGVRTFFHLKKVLGRPERTLIGSADDLSIEQVRAKASDLNAKLAEWKKDGYQGSNPVERVSRGTTLNDVVEDYIERRLEKFSKNPEAAAKWTRWAVGRYLASWKNRTLGSITRREVVERLQTIADEHGRVIANRSIELLGRLYGWAARTEVYTGVDPTAHVDLFPERERQRFLSEDELGRMWAALKKEKNRNLRDFVTIALLCGARRSDIQAMRWADIDLDHAVWRVPMPKNSIPYEIPLPDRVISVLKTRSKSSDFVFAGSGASGHLVEPKRGWGKLLERAGITNFTFHDCRRTYGSWLASGGTSLPIIGRALGHQDMSSTAIYARLDLRAVRESVVAATKEMLAAKPARKKQLVAARP